MVKRHNLTNIKLERNHFIEKAGKKPKNSLFSGVIILPISYFIKNPSQIYPFEQLPQGYYSLSMLMSKKFIPIYHIKALVGTQKTTAKPQNKADYTLSVFTY